MKPTHHSIAHLWDKGERVKAMAKEAELDEADTDDPDVDDESSSGSDKAGGGDGVTWSQTMSFIWETVDITFVVSVFVLGGYVGGWRAGLVHIYFGC